MGQLRAPLPVVADINVLVDAVVAEPDQSGWKSPPPVRGDPAAMALGILNQGVEFGLWLSPHILTGSKRVVTEGFGFEQQEADRYERVLVDIALRTGGVITPDLSVHDCRDWEDNRILELAEAAGALLIISSDADLLEISPWRGIPVMQPAQFVARVDALRRKRRRSLRE